MSFASLLEHEAAWWASDNRITSADARALVAAAYVADRDSDELIYLSARLESMRDGSVPLSVLIAAIGGGNSYAARRARAMLQRRDRFGQFAEMGGSIRFLIKMLGKMGGAGTVRGLTGRTVAQAPNDSWDIETPDGKLYRVPASSGEAIAAVLPSQETSDGYSTGEISSSSSDPIINESDLVEVEAPFGYKRDPDYKPIEEDVETYGLEEAGTLYVDGEYGVIKYEAGSDIARDKFEEMKARYEAMSEEERESTGFAVKNRAGELEYDPTRPVFLLTEKDDADADDFFGAVQTWADVQDTIAKDEKKFKGIDLSNEEEFGGPDDVDDAEQPQATPTPTPEEAEEFDLPELRYDSNTQYGVDPEATYEPQGRTTQEAPDYTDDPNSLQALYPKNDLLDALSQGVFPQEDDEDGVATGFGALDFGDGTEEGQQLEWVPVEAIEQTLRLQGVNTKMALQDIYNGGDGKLETPEDFQRVLDEADEKFGPLAAESPVARLDDAPEETPQDPQEPSPIENIPGESGQEKAEWLEENAQKTPKKAKDLKPGDLIIRDGEAFEVVFADEGEIIYEKSAFDPQDRDEIVGSGFLVLTKNSDGEEVYIGLDPDDGFNKEPVDPDEFPFGPFEGEIDPEESFDVYEVDAADPEPIAELPESEPDPSAPLPLAEGLSPEELEDFNKNYRPFLPENQEFDVPEGYATLDPDPMVFMPEANLDIKAQEGNYENARVLAENFDENTLKDALRKALEPSEEGLEGYGQLELTDSDGEKVPVNVTGEAIRDALQLLGEDTNSFIDSVYAEGRSGQGDDAPTPDEVDSALEGEGLDPDAPEVETAPETPEADVPEGGEDTGEINPDAQALKDAGNVTQKDVADLQPGDLVIYNGEIVNILFVGEDEIIYQQGSDPSGQNNVDVPVQTFLIRGENLAGKDVYIGLNPDSGLNPEPINEADLDEGWVDQFLPGDTINTYTLGSFQAPEAPEAPEVGDPTYNTSNWTQVGGQSGSNEGGLFEDPDGNRYYVKKPKSESHARNEALASALYEEAGVRYGSVFLGRDGDGNTVLVSPIVPDSSDDFKDRYIVDPNVKQSAQEDFVVDAWLRNWDSVGLNFDNMITVGDEVYRIDPGGSLLYRAQGAEKPNEMGPTVDELDSLRDPAVNAQAAEIFGDMTDEQLAESAQKVANISPERIDELVDSFFDGDAETAALLKERLKQRRESLIERFNLGETLETVGAPAVEQMPQDLDEAGVESFVRDAIENGNPIGFRYKSQGGELRDRVIQPTEVKESKDGSVFVVGIDEEGKIKQFRLAYISFYQRSDSEVPSSPADIDEETSSAFDIPSPALLPGEQKIIDALEDIDAEQITTEPTSPDDIKAGDIVLAYGTNGEMTSHVVVENLGKIGPNKVSTLQLIDKNGNTFNDTRAVVDKVSVDSIDSEDVDYEKELSEVLEEMALSGELTPDVPSNAFIDPNNAEKDQVEISEVQKGDFVLYDDPSTGEVNVLKVTDAYSVQNGAATKLEMEDSEGGKYEEVGAPGVVVTTVSEAPEPINLDEADLEKTSEIPEKVQQKAAADAKDLANKLFNEEIIEPGSIADTVDALNDISENAPQISDPVDKVAYDVVALSVPNPDDEGIDVDAIDLEALEKEIGDAADPDLIWAKVVESYSGQILPNQNHVVVKSFKTPDGARIDIVVRRTDKETFHVYFRVFDSEGNSKIYLRKRQLHSFTALDNEIKRSFAQGATKYQIIQNKATPETPEFSFPTATPLQKSSYVSADGQSIVQVGDVIERLDKNGNVIRGVVGKRANIYVSKKEYEYTDYVRVKLDNGKYDWMPTSKLTIVKPGDAPGAPTPPSPETPSTPLVPPPGTPPTPVAPVAPEAPEASDPFADDAPVPDAPPSSKPKQNAPAGAPEVGQTYTGNGKTYRVMGYDRENGNIIVTVDDGQSWEPRIISTTVENWKTLSEDIEGLDQGEVKEPYFPGAGSILNKPSYEDEAGNVWTPVIQGVSGGKANKETYLLTGVDKNGKPMEAPIAMTQDDINEFVKIDAFKPVGAINIDGDGIIASGINSKGPEFLEKVGAPSYSDYKAGIQGTLVKSKDGKYIVSGFLVKDDSGNTGIVTKTNSSTDRADVLWLEGPNKGMTDNDAYAGSLTRTDSWVDPETAKAMGVSGIDASSFEAMKKKNEEKLKAEAAAKKIAAEQAKIKAEIDAKKAGDTVKASGFESETVSGPADWSSSPVENISSLSDALEASRSSNEKEAAKGSLALLDSDAIEDLEVRVHKVLDENGEEAIRVQFGLTDWAGNALTKRLKKLKEGITEGVTLNKWTKQGSLLRKDSSGKNISSKGATYTGDAGKGKYTIYRANTTGTSPNYFTRPGSGSPVGPVAFHNKVEILLPADATPEDIADAIKDLQITKHVRPPTESDVRGVIENKLIRMFSSKTDGRINYTGETRQIALQSIKDTWGVSAEDVEISPTGSRGFAFLLPESVGQQISNMTGVNHIAHRWTGGGAGYPENGSAEEKANWLFNFVTDGNLLSTVDRWTEGIYVHGMSSKTDTKGPGGEFVFTSKYSGPLSEGGGSGGTLTFYFDGAKVLRRLDHYSNSSDLFGQLKEEQNYINSLNGYVHEILFKNSISWADLSGIALPDAVRALLIEKLTAVDHDFGGRTPDEVLGKQGA
jgi:hypothetical protein